MPGTPRIGKTCRRAALAAALAFSCHYFSPDHPDAQGYTPLMRAAEVGDVAEIQRLLERGAYADYQGRRVRRISILFPFTDSSVEDTPYHGWTPLMVAARAGQAAATSVLLAAGAAPDLRGADGTALRMAAEAGHAGAVSALLAGRADPKQRDPEGRRPIHVAVRNGHRDAVHAFLSTGTDLGGGEDSFHAENALIEAVARGQSVLVRELFEAGAVALLPIAGRERERAYLSAIGHGHLEVARIPVAAIVDLATPFGAERGDALLAAIARGDPDAVAARATAGVDLRGPLGAGVLAAAAAAGQPALVRALASAGASVEAADRDGATPLLRAASAGRAEALAALLDAGAGIETPGRKARTALMNAAEAGQADAVRFLLERGARVDARDAGGWTAWMFADRAGQTEVAQILVRAGADPTGGARSRALSAAVASGDLPAVQASLKAGADPDVGDDEGKRPLEVAIRAKRRDLVEMLIAAGADLNANQNASGYTPLRLAITTDQIEIVQQLLAAGADPNARSSIAGTLETPMLMAAGTGLEEIVRALVAAGADLCTPTPNGGETPLGRARRLDPGYSRSGGSIPKVALLLAELGAETDPTRCSNYRALEERAESASRAELDRALVAAASAGRVESVRLLLAHQADPNAVGAPGRPALVAAADGGHAEALRALLAAGADARRPAADGTTPLLAATRAGRAEVVLALREAGVGDPLELGGLERALIHAAWAGDAARVRRLLAAGAQRDWREDIHRSAYQKPALFAAAEEGHTEVVRALLEAGADPNARLKFFHTHTTPLQIAVGEGRVDTVVVLIAAGADVNYRDERGNTPLSDARGRSEASYQQRRADYARIAALLEQAGARDAEEQASR